MQTKTHTLISPTLGTTRNLLSFHYGPGNGQKIYIQSSLHADELPGMLVAWHLRQLLTEFEAAGKLRGEVIVVPVSNPIGLNQNLHGTQLGRFEMNSGQNFNRNFYDLAALVAPRIEGMLSGDINANKLAIRTAMRAALDEQLGDGAVSTIAWTHAGKPTYSFEGIINYAAATIQWLKDQLGLINDASETEA